MNPNHHHHQPFHGDENLNNKNNTTNPEEEEHNIPYNPNHCITEKILPIHEIDHHHQQQQGSSIPFSSPYDRILHYLSEDRIKAYEDHEGFRHFCVDQKYESSNSRWLEAADYATCRALCERFYVLHLLQSVTQKVALLAIACMLNRYEDDNEEENKTSGGHFHVSDKDREELQQWDMIDLIHFVNRYYKKDYEQFKETFHYEESIGEPKTKKNKSNEKIDCDTSGNSRIGKIKFDSNKFKNFYSSLLVMKELIEKEQTSHDDLVTSIENVYKQHIFSCIRYFNSSYGKNPMLERFYYHILELYRQTEHKLSCIKFAKFGMFYARRHVQLLTRMRDVLLHQSPLKNDFEIIEKFLIKHIKHCKAHEKCLEGILLFFYDCTDIDLMTRIFVESSEIDDTFGYSHCNLGYLKGFNAFGSAALTAEGIEHFHQSLRRASISDLKLMTANSYKTLGILNIIIGNIPESIQCHSKALQIYPNYYDIIKDRCEMSSMTNDLPSALRDLQKCLEIGPQRKKDLSDLYNMFAIFQQKLGTSLDDLKLVLENALRLDPSNSYAFLTLSTFAIEQQDLDEYLDLRLVFRPTSYQGICDLLNQDVAAFAVFDPIHNTQLEEEYRTKRKHFTSSYLRIS
ncbi:hypothetical protein FDP41_001761 [Naegleria fowleri]|uniref:Uncharacterized protein n=1 Tax=Naegleria fowleri TaxID=5763 RepID=A0A6A5C0J2_NAEFO|nr:uncharacterized protein FDP41_001761 [Naegleria fowleri]KAF0979418.1 hypothetical protein FDP41_001761 [Naegleria fowleri]